MCHFWNDMGNLPFFFLEHNHLFLELKTFVLDHLGDDNGYNYFGTKKVPKCKLAYRNFLGQTLLEQGSNLLNSMQIKSCPSNCYCCCQNGMLQNFKKNSSCHFCTKYRSDFLHVIDQQTQHSTPDNKLPHLKFSPLFLHFCTVSKCSFQMFPNMILYFVKLQVHNSFYYLHSEKVCSNNFVC